MGGIIVAPLPVDKCWYRDLVQDLNDLKASDDLKVFIAAALNGCFYPEALGVSFDNTLSQAFYDGVDIVAKSFGIEEEFEKECVSSNYYNHFYGLAKRLSLFFKDVLINHGVTERHIFQLERIGESDVTIRVRRM